ncbi:MAG: agmatine deiminase family protein [Pseudomonadales bacterium]|nr:agmatine deiminase family protein [Pseudomonadales bacterium]
MTTSHTKTFLAEWSRQEAVLLAWPHPDTDWHPWLADIEASYHDLVAAIAPYATPLILCKDNPHQNLIQSRLGEALSNQVVFHVCPYNDTWCRDYGPISVGNQRTEHLLSFRFTGWGNKYQASDDNLVNKHLEHAHAWAVPVVEINLDLEGGAIETDGAGTLLTTEACLLANNRNRSMNKSAIDKALQQHLGVDRVLWLRNGYLQGDDTDSHVDNLVRFANRNTLVYADCNNQKDPHFEALKAMEAELKCFTTRDGTAYQCIPLAIPEAIYEGDTRLPASYVNFLILNEAIIFPIFNCEADESALSNIQKAFPQHRIVPINGRNFIKQYGGPHCATMQLPKGVLQPSFVNLGDTQC